MHIFKVWILSVSSSNNMQRRAHFADIVSWKPPMSAMIHNHRGTFDPCDNTLAALSCQYNKSEPLLVVWARQEVWLCRALFRRKIQTGFLTQMSHQSFHWRYFDWGVTNRSYNGCMPFWSIPIPYSFSCAYVLMCLNMEWSSLVFTFFAFCNKMSAVEKIYYLQ